MTAKRPLRAVAANEKAPAKKKLTSVTQAVDDGTSRDVFITMQRRIAKAIDDPNIRGADLASLTRRLHEIRKDIEALDAREQQEADEGGEVSDEAFDASAV